MTPQRKIHLRNLIEEFNIQYAAALDTGGDIEKWPDFFTADATYKITSQENFELGLQGGIVFDDSQGMMRDRAYALAHTQYFAPRYNLHICGNVQVLEESDHGINATSNYIFMETLVEDHTRLHIAGQYHDIFVFDNDRLLLKKRTAVYHSNFIRSVLIYPV
jgi:anthranilate 1,2-dioxygenase small subunit